MKEINDSTRRALLHIVEQLREGFTGRFEIECHQGGVRDVRQIQRVDLRAVDGDVIKL